MTASSIKDVDGSRPARPGSRQTGRDACARLTRGKAAIAALLVLLPLSDALAEGTPLSLLPSNGSSAVSPAPIAPPAPAGQPLPLAPSAGAPIDIISPSATTTEAPGPHGDKILVQSLSAPDPSATGVLDSTHGGFGFDMWAGTSLAVVQKVLPLLPNASPWRSLQQLERRLLLTAAQVPSGKAAGDSLLKLRADKLWAAGDIDGLTALLKVVPDSALTPELRHLQIDAALLAGDASTACQQGPLLRQAASDDPFSAKLQVFCQFSTGKASEAGLGVDLLREQKVNDGAFFTASDSLAGIAPGKLDGFAGASPLSLAMARLAKLALPESSVANQSAAGLRAIALMPTASLEARLVAAEKAEAVGAVDTDVLRQLYLSVSFSPQELTQPLTAGGTDKGTRSRALLYRATDQQTLPAAKAELITKALSLAGEGPAYFTAARLYAPQIATIKPAPELAGFAYPAARALFAAHKAEVAQAWLVFARGLGTDAGSATAAALWPLARLASPEGDRPVAAGTLAAWRKARGDLPPAAMQRRATVAYSLLTALGDKVPADDWLTLYDAPPVAVPPVRPALWHGLRAATEDLRLGETVMFSLATLGDASLGQADLIDLYRVVAALRLIGLDADARALAEEAAIANGV